MLLFASVAQAAGTRRLQVRIESEATVEDVCRLVVSMYPELERFVPNLLFAVDEEYAEATTIVRPGQTVALIPPVSGG